MQRSSNLVRLSTLGVSSVVSAILAILASFSAAARADDTANRLIPIKFELAKPGFVTLVIDDSEGNRVRNLISEESFEAGSHTVWWDGLDDLDRDRDAASHAIYHIPGKLVSPGSYTVRGLTQPGIDLVYRMTPYTHGNPPWRTADPGSQWLTNHSAPSDVIFLPPGAAPEREGKPSSRDGQVIVCSRVAEGGSGLAWINLDGQKLWGQHWLGGVWTAASHLAVDRGDHPVPGAYAYAAASWAGDKYNDNQSELRLHKLVDADHRVTAPRDKRFGTGEDRPVLEPTYKLPLPADLPAGFDPADKAQRSKYAASLTGLAVRNGIVVTAFERLNHLLFIDAHASKVIGTANVTEPRGLAFDLKGNLYAISGHQLLRFTVTAAKLPTLPSPTVIATGLDDPQYVIVGDDGTIYVSDWGASHQVKLFSSNGKALGAIGDPGAPRMGAYNPHHLNNPAGMALDNRGRLWVTENTHIPKRVSIWNVGDRTLAEAFYGPMRYGGSGAVDPQDKTRFFYDDDHGGTIEFKLDYKTGRSTPVSIPYLKAYNETGLVGRYTGAAPSYPLHHGDFLYLTDTYNHHTTGRRSTALWRLDSDGVASIVAAAGDILDSSRKLLPAFTAPELQAAMPKDVLTRREPHLLFVWSDLSGDQKLQVNEVQFLDPKELGGDSMGAVTASDDLSFSFSAVGDAVLQLMPISIDAKGVPTYAVAQHKILATGVQSPASSGGGQVLPAKDGWVVTTTPVKPLAREGLGAVHNGKPLWSYPSLWPGLHASHIAPRLDDPGKIIGTTRVIGPVIDAPPGSDAGQFWAINGNKGTIYVFTVDGLFVTRLFQDSRTTSWDASEAIPGMKVNDLSLQEECFGPTWTRTTDGDVLLQCHFVGSIVQIQNLDKVHRLPNQAITVTAEQLTAAQQYNIDQEARRQTEANDQAKPLIAVIRQKPPVIDGKADDWQDAQFVTIDKRLQQVGNWGKRENITQASLAFTGDSLVAIWRTHDRKLMASSGESLNNLFKCGGALDLTIGTDPTADPDRRAPVKGDLRVLITLVKGKPTAVLYEPVAPEADGAPVEFGSPLRTLRFDRVDVISDTITFATQTTKDLEADKDGNVNVTTYEVAIPLSLLGFKPKAGATYKLDLGILRGDGYRTLQRVYWHNKKSGLVSDIPGEAELIPALWGEVTLKSEVSAP